jgi:DNA-binding transcriptional MerR regulator
MRSVHAGDVATALAELDRSHADFDRERSEIAGVVGAFAALMPLPAAAPARNRFRIGAVADAVGVRTSALRVWERHGLLRPSRERATGYRVYDDGEVRRARVVALLRKGNYPISIVRAVIEELRTTGSPQRVRIELAKREQDLHRRSLLRLQASAALYEYLTRV